MVAGEVVLWALAAPVARTRAAPKELAKRKVDIGAFSKKVVGADAGRFSSATVYWLRRWGGDGVKGVLTIMQEYSA
jgi:hypothetical protein